MLALTDVTAAPLPRFSVQTNVLFTCVHQAQPGVAEQALQHLYVSGVEKDMIAVPV